MEEKIWSDDDMITFAEWYTMWNGHPDVGTNAYQAFKKWKKMVRKEKLKKIK